MYIHTLFTLHKKFNKRYFLPFLFLFSAVISNDEAPDMGISSWRGKIPDEPNIQIFGESSSFFDDDKFNISKLILILLTILVILLFINYLRRRRATRARHRNSIVRFLGF